MTESGENLVGSAYLQIKVDTENLAESMQAAVDNAIAQLNTEVSLVIKTEGGGAVASGGGSPAVVNDPGKSRASAQGVDVNLGSVTGISEAIQKGINEAGKGFALPIDATFLRGQIEDALKDPFTLKIQIDAESLKQISNLRIGVDVPQGGAPSGPAGGTTGGGAPSLTVPPQFTRAIADPTFRGMIQNAWQLVATEMRSHGKQFGGGLDLNSEGNEFLKFKQLIDLMGPNPQEWFRKLNQVAFRPGEWVAREGLDPASPNLNNAFANIHGWTRTAGASSRNQVTLTDLISLAVNAAMSSGATAPTGPASPPPAQQEPVVTPQVVERAVNAAAVEARAKLTEQEAQAKQRPVTEVMNELNRPMAKGIAPMDDRQIVANLTRRIAEFSTAATVASGTRPGGEDVLIRGRRVDPDQVAKDEQRLRYLLGRISATQRKYVDEIAASTTPLRPGETAESPSYKRRLQATIDQLDEVDIPDAAGLKLVGDNGGMTLVRAVREVEEIDRRLNIARLGDKNYRTPTGVTVTGSRATIKGLVGPGDVRATTNLQPGTGRDPARAGRINRPTNIDEWHKDSGYWINPLTGEVVNREAFDSAGRMYNPVTKSEIRPDQSKNWDRMRQETILEGAEPLKAQFIPGTGRELSTAEILARSQGQIPTPVSPSDPNYSYYGLIRMAQLGAFSNKAIYLDDKGKETGEYVTYVDEGDDNPEIAALRAGRKPGWINGRKAMGLSPEQYALRMLMSADTAGRGLVPHADLLDRANPEAKVGDSPDAYARIVLRTLIPIAARAFEYNMQEVKQGAESGKQSGQYTGTEMSAQDYARLDMQFADTFREWQETRNKMAATGVPREKQELERRAKKLADEMQALIGQGANATILPVADVTPELRMQTLIGLRQAELDRGAQSREMVEQGVGVSEHTKAKRRREDHDARENYVIAMGALKEMEDLSERMWSTDPEKRLDVTRENLPPGYDVPQARNPRTGEMEPGPLTRYTFTRAHLSAILDRFKQSIGVPMTGDSSVPKDFEESLGAMVRAILKDVSGEADTGDPALRRSTPQEIRRSMSPTSFAEQDQTLAEAAAFRMRRREEPVTDLDFRIQQLRSLQTVDGGNTTADRQLREAAKLRSEADALLGKGDAGYMGDTVDRVQTGWAKRGRGRVKDEAGVEREIEGMQRPVYRETTKEEREATEARATALKEQADKIEESVARARRAAGRAIEINEYVQRQAVELILDQGGASHVAQQITPPSLLQQRDGKIGTYKGGRVLGFAAKPGVPVDDEQMEALRAFLNDETIGARHVARPTSSLLPKLDPMRPAAPVYDTSVPGAMIRQSPTMTGQGVRERLAATSPSDVPDSYVEGVPESQREGARAAILREAIQLLEMGAAPGFTREDVERRKAAERGQRMGELGDLIGALDKTLALGTEYGNDVGVPERSETGEIRASQTTTWGMLRRQRAEAAHELEMLQQQGRHYTGDDNRRATSRTAFVANLDADKEAGEAAGGRGGAGGGGGRGRGTTAGAGGAGGAGDGRTPSGNTMNVIIVGAEKAIPVYFSGDGGPTSQGRAWAANNISKVNVARSYRAIRDADDAWTDDMRGPEGPGQFVMPGVPGVTHKEGRANTLYKHLRNKGYDDRAIYRFMNSQGLGPQALLIMSRLGVIDESGNFTGGSAGGDDALMRRFGISATGRDSAFFSEVDKADVRRSELMATARRAERGIPKRGFTASVTDIFSNLGGLLDDQVAATGLYQREGTQLASLLAQGPALQQRRARAQAQVSALTAERDELKEIRENAPGLSKEERQAYKKEIDQLDGAIARATTRTTRATEALDDYNVALKYQEERVGEAEKGLPGAGARIGAFAIGGLAAGGAFAVGQIITQMTSEAIKVVGDELTKVADRMSGFANTASKVSDSLSDSTRALNGNATAAVAQTVAMSGLNDMTYQNIRYSLENRAELEAGNKALDEQNQIIKTARYLNKGDTGFMGTGFMTRWPGLTSGTGGFLDTGWFGGTPSSLRGMLGRLPGENINDSIAANWFPNLTAARDLLGRNIANGQQTATDRLIGDPAVMEEFQKNIASFNVDLRETGVAFRLTTKATKEQADVTEAAFRAINASQIELTRLRDLQIGITDVNGKPLTMEDVEALGPEIATSILEGLSKGAQSVSSDVMLDSMTRQFNAQVGAIEANSLLQRRALTANVGLGYMSNQPIDTQTALFGSNYASMLGGSPFGAAMASVTGVPDEALRTWDRLKGIAVPVMEEIERATTAGYEELKKFGVTDEQISNLMKYSDQIKALTEDMITRQTEATFADYNRNFEIAKRTLGDIMGLVGQTNLKLNDGTEVQSTQLGILQKTVLEKSRELTLLGQELTQRQINFRLATAGFTSSGRSPEETAAIRDQALYETGIAQRQLNLQKGITGAQFQIVDEQNLRSLKDTLYEVNKMQRDFQISIDIKGDQDLIAKLSSLKEIIVGDIGISMSEYQALEQMAIQTAATMQQSTDEAFTHLLNRSRDTIAEISRLYGQALNGEPVQPTSQTQRNDERHYGDTGGPGTPSNYTGGLVVNGSLVSFGNVEVRSQEDLDEIVDRVTESLNRTSALIGLRSPVGS